MAGLPPRRRLSLSGITIRSLSTEDDDGSIPESHDERTPLVRQDNSYLVKKRKTKEAWRTELRILWKLTVINGATYAIEYFIGAFSTVTLGHLGNKELNAASLSHVLITSTTIAPFVYGLCSALDTLASQAFTSPKPKNTSLYVMRTGVLVYACLIPMLVVLSFTDRILLFLKQEPEIAHLAGRYSRVYVLGMPFVAGYELMRRWLQAQGIVTPATIIVLLGAPLSVGLNWLLVLGPPNIRIGFLGAPIAVVITNVTTFLLLLLYCAIWAPKTAYAGFSRAIFLDLGPNIRLGIAGIVSTCSEWLVWDIVSFAASYLGEVEYAASAASNFIAILSDQQGFALGTAAGIRVGNAVGAQRAEQAKFAAKVAYISSIALGLFNLVLVFALRPYLGRLISSDEEVIALVAKALIPIAFYQVADAITLATFGILRGAGLAQLVARANLFSYWLTGLPIAIVLAYKAGLGVVGLYSGMAISLTILAVITSISVKKIDWKKSCMKAKEQSEATEAFLESRRISQMPHD